MEFDTKFSIALKSLGGVTVVLTTLQYCKAVIRVPNSTQLRAAYNPLKRDALSPIEFGALITPQAN